MHGCMDNSTVQNKKQSFKRVDCAFVRRCIEVKRGLVLRPTLHRLRKDFMVVSETRGGGGGSCYATRPMHGCMDNSTVQNKKQSSKRVLLTL